MVVMVVMVVIVVVGINLDTTCWYGLLSSTAVHGCVQGRVLVGVLASQILIALGLLMHDPSHAGKATAHGSGIEQRFMRPSIH